MYKRFEVSVALPVEYGSVNFGAVAVALGFYDEHLYMESWQLALQLVGCALILVGIGVGHAECGRSRRAPPRRRDHIAPARCRAVFITCDRR